MARPIRWLGPGRLGQRPVRVEGDGLAVDVDLAGGFPVTADGRVGQLRIPCRHPMGVVVQDPADDLLRHVPVDQLGAERVPPLVRGQVDGLAVLVADVAAFQPAVQRPAVGVWSPTGRRPSGLPLSLREQPRSSLGPSGSQALAVFADGAFQLLIDRDERLAFHLVVVIAQVGSAVGVADDAVAGQAERVGDAQPAAHQDEGDQLVMRGCSTGRGCPAAPAGPSRARSARGAATGVLWGGPPGRTSRSSAACCPSRAGGSR